MHSEKRARKMMPLGEAERKCLLDYLRWAERWTDVEKW